ncbi:MAG: small subunit ribosomal protein S18 [Planctomycetota bacterium]|jgi:small subunit ribosomal protein S18
MQCYFKQNNIKFIDYKDVDILKKFITPSGKIMAGKRSGVCPKSQRGLSRAIKNARYMGFMPYIQA